VFKINRFENLRQEWLLRTLSGLPAGSKILDAGAGELKNKQHCVHLNYASQDFCQYEGVDSTCAGIEGLQNDSWDTSRIDIVCDIVAIPAADESYDAILCSEVLEHVPEPTLALDEFARLLKPGGKLILTAPFASLVHMAPYHFCSGFSKYWYQHHLTKKGFSILELKPNGDWFNFALHEILRMGSQERKVGNITWPIAYLLGIFGLLYSKIRPKKSDSGLACIGWHCVAIKDDMH
jgi:SAM-dependent methyltransferase